MIVVFNHIKSKPIGSNGSIDLKSGEVYQPAQEMKDDVDEVVDCKSSGMSSPLTSLLLKVSEMGGSTTTWGLSATPMTLHLCF